jgi:putative proteasome-type protease
VTYCLALRLSDSLVFVADTRTNAGLDNVGTYRKLHVLDAGPDRAFVLQSAGNLATTQEVLDRIRSDLARSGRSEVAGHGGAHESLATVDHLYEAALYVGRLSQEVVARHRDGLSRSKAHGTATFILGGQIAGEAADILLVYPEGNYIRASDERPFLQIGESKYGKFMLELGVRAHLSGEKALKMALSSMVSTARANLSVGPPYDVGIYRNDSLHVEEHRVDESSAYLHELQESWIKHMLDAIDQLPPITSTTFQV